MDFWFNSSWPSLNFEEKHFYPEHIRHALMVATQIFSVETSSFDYLFDRGI